MAKKNQSTNIINPEALYKAGYASTAPVEDRNKDRDQFINQAFKFIGKTIYNHYSNGYKHLNSLRDASTSITAALDTNVDKMFGDGTNAEVVESLEEWKAQLLKGQKSQSYGIFGKKAKGRETSANAWEKMSNLKHHIDLLKAQAETDKANGLQELGIDHKMGDAIAGWSNSAFAVEFEMSAMLANGTLFEYIGVNKETGGLILRREVTETKEELMQKGMTSNDADDYISSGKNVSTKEVPIEDVKFNRQKDNTLSNYLLNNVGESIKNGGKGVEWTDNWNTSRRSIISEKVNSLTDDQVKSYYFDGQGLEGGGTLSTSAPAYINLINKNLKPGTPQWIAAMEILKTKSFGKNSDNRKTIIDNMLNAEKDYHMDELALFNIEKEKLKVEEEALWNKRYNKEKDTWYTSFGYPDRAIAKNYVDKVANEVQSIKDLQGVDWQRQSDGTYITEWETRNSDGTYSKNSKTRTPDEMISSQEMDSRYPDIYKTLYDAREIEEIPEIIAANKNSPVKEVITTKEGEVVDLQLPGQTFSYQTTSIKKVNGVWKKQMFGGWSDVTPKELNKINKSYK